jgi:hypothetical protein
MHEFQKVVVVDNGDRPQDFALSAELAEMGFASVTTPVETADDVLAIVRSPAAIVLHMPHRASWAERQRFMAGDQAAFFSAIRTRFRRIVVVALRRSSGSSMSRMNTMRMSGRTFAKDACSAT